MYYRTDIGMNSSNNYWLFDAFPSYIWFTIVWQFYENHDTVLYVFIKQKYLDIYLLFQLSKDAFKINL